MVNATHPWNDAFVHDPTCVRVVSPAVLSLFDRHIAATDPLAEKNKVDFEIVERRAILAEPYRGQFETGELAHEDAARLVDSCLNVCSEFQMELRAHKPARPPLEA